jgi:hypothetical protein
LDQLPAEQRAIVELVVQRGRSYETLADVLQVPSERVRELARDALSELSPRTASRVDAERRGQIADYLLRQQSADEERSTRDYLKSSETARAWALSLLDSLDPLYANGASPPVPEPGADGDAAPSAAAVVDERPAEPLVAVPEAVPEAEPAEPVAETPEPVAQAPEPTAEAEPVGQAPEATAEAEPVAEAPEPKAEGKPAAAAETAEDRVRARDRERARKKPLREAESPAAEPDTKPVRRGAALSPAAQSALRRRRIVGAGAGLALLAAIVVGVLALAGAFSSDKKASSSASSGSTTSGTSTTPSQAQVQVVGGIALNPIGGTKAQGVAYIVQQGAQRYVVVQAQVPPLPNNQKVAAYEVWLYNSNSDARSLGAQYTNNQGVLQGRAPLPADVTKFKAIDISRELFSDKNAGHGNSSVLRGTFASIKPVQQQPQGATTTPTTPTTPGP